MTVAHSNFQPRRIIPGLILGFFVLLALAFLGDWDQVSNMVRNFNWAVIPFVLFLTLFNYFLRFIKWHFYLMRVGIRDLPWHQSMRLFVAGFPLAVTPGKVGEALKGVWLKKQTGLPVGQGISVIVAERISDGLAVMMLSTFGVIAYPQYWPVFISILLILLSVVVLFQVRPAAIYILDSAQKLPLVHRLTPGLRDFYEGSFTLFRPLPTVIAVGLGMVSWFGEGVGFYLILTGLGIEPGLRLFSLAIFILGFSTIVGAVSALPGGLGAAEISIAGMLALLIPIDRSLSTAATLLIRMATLWFGVSLGLIVWGFSMDFLGFRSRPPSGENISTLIKD